MTTNQARTFPSSVSAKADKATNAHQAIDAMDLIQIATALEDLTHFPATYTDATTIGQMRSDLQQAYRDGHVPDAVLPDIPV